MLRRRRVVLLDAPPDLAQKPRLERSLAGEHRLGVGLLRAQVRHHVVALALGMVVAEPVVLVHPVAVRAPHDERLLARHGRHGPPRGVPRHGRPGRGAAGGDRRGREHRCERERSEGVRRHGRGG